MNNKTICTKDKPYREGDPKPIQHPDAVCTYDGGYEQQYERYKCPNCNLEFTVILSQ